MRFIRWIRHRDRDLDDELTFHVEAHSRELIDEGVPPDEARRRALAAFGGMAPIKEQTRDAGGGRWLHEFAADLRYAARTVRHQPGFAAVAVLTLTLGIGANTAIFSIVESVLLRSLPVQKPQELFFIEAAGSEGGNGAPPYPCFERFRRETTAFAGMSAFASDHLRVVVGGEVEQVMGQVASGNYFELLGVTPALGRLMNAGDERLDPPVAVISHAYWQRRFGGAPAAIGRTISYRDRTFTIVGVTAPSFWGLAPGQRIDLTLPITVEGNQLANAGAWWFDVVARVKPDAPLVQARQQTDAVFQTFMKDTGSSSMRARYFDHIELESAGRGTGMLRRRFGEPLYGLTIVAGLVLLIACANLCSLLLVRGASRSRELAIRLAIGAGRSRIVRQLLTETALLFAVGALAGTLLARVATQALVGFFAIGRTPVQLDVDTQWTPMLFAAGIALVCAVVTGLWPALRALRADPNTALHDGGARSVGSRRSGLATRTLIAVQAAIAFVLVVAAILFGRTLFNLRGLDLGFARTNILTMSIDPMLPPDAPPGSRPQFWARVLERVQARPGVRSASLSVLTPLSGRDTTVAMTAPGFTPQQPQERFVRVNHVSAGYFETFALPVVSGHTFMPASGTGRRVVVLNETAARMYFGGREPLGQIVRFGNDAREVIGVVGDFKHMGLREPAMRFAFIPIEQPLSLPGRVTLSVASQDPAAALSRALADDVRSVHAATLVSDLMRVEDQVNVAILSERLLAALSTVLAAIAIGLAAVGVFGVLSYSLAARRPEFGLRLALGASTGRLARCVLLRVLRDVAIGVAIGGPLALAAARAAERQLFGVESNDPWIYLTSAAVLATAACVAAWLPIRQTCSLDPAAILRD